MSMYKYDDLLSFDLPADFCIIEDVNDDGEPVYGIGVGKTANDSGEASYENRVNIQVREQDADNPIDVNASKIQLKGNIRNNFVTARNTQSFLGIEIVITTTVLFLIHDKKLFILSSNFIGTGERQEKWLQFINTVLASVVLDGQKGDFEKITDDMLDNESGEEAEETTFFAKYPVATPAKDQHSHLDFLEKTKSGLGMLGGFIQVNQSGTEYSFEELDECFAERFDDEDIFEGINKANTKYPLAKTAREMGEIFRVSESAFDESEDREQEIESGLLRRCAMYEAFRSFAWTLAAYCDRENISPEQVDIDAIEEIADFVVEQRGRLNYIADSFCPTLCSGDDIHNFYIPDATPKAARKVLEAAIAEASEDDGSMPSAVLSLDGLRKDMQYLFPVMQTIYNSLASERDFDEPLEGPVAEVLYVWCSMTYAIRNPVYTEDGPMNCFWNHPGKMPVLQSFGKAVKRSEKPLDCDYSFTYKQGITFENEHYIFRFPDGFVVKEGEENRDFVAYLPKEDDPDDYTESDFIIYAGKDLNGENNSQMKLPLTYHAVLNGFTTQMPDAEGWYYHRKDLPGLFAITADNFCLHANALVAYEDILKMIRFQVSISGKKQAKAYEALLKSMMDQMVAKQPVEILDEIDDAKYVNMTLSKEEVAQWEKLMDDYSTQIAIARNQRQNQIVQSIRSNNPGIAKVRKMLKDLLRQYTEASAEYLKKADAIYQLKKMQYPNASLLKKIKKAIDDAFLDLVLQYVMLDAERIEFEDPYNAVYKKHGKLAATEAAEDILRSCRDALSGGLVSALEKTMAERAAAEAEERAKREAAMQIYKKEHARWEADCETIKKKRASYVDEKIAAERIALNAAAITKRDKAVAEANAIIAGEEARLKDAETKLESLGLFSFGEKKTQKGIIEDAKMNIVSAAKARSTAEDTCNEETANIEKTLKDKIISFRNAAAKQYAMPEEPKKPC